MEALDAMSKTNKSYYRWHGLEGLPKLMADLQKEAVEERLPERVLRVEQAMCSFTELSPGSRNFGMKEVVGRCRRLYDIANVLVALGLIKKVHYLFGTKKIPLFVYCGPEPNENSTFDVNACIERLSASTCSTPTTPQMKVLIVHLKCLCSARPQFFRFTVKSSKHNISMSSTVHYTLQWASFKLCEKFKRIIYKYLVTEANPLFLNTFSCSCSILYASSNHETCAITNFFEKRCFIALL
ncbi:unnamed protein product [Strongylus vulgaris]|uniref:E2F/DP family winged-helix DNA-binding domain-containing protein n=1 Tax=Strongylus vulgaris TaxID=40348 RepID=A0A3P7JJL9_STRVU|nr:unnamed protein product [Strongylus vulgaris]